MDTWEIKISSCDCPFYYSGDCEYMAPSPIFKCTKHNCPRKIEASKPDVEVDDCLCNSCSNYHDNTFDI